MAICKPAQRGEIYPLNWVRAVAATLVVFYHCDDIMSKSKYFNAEVVPLFRAGDSGVQLFFVLSGFVIYLAHSRDPQQDISTIKSFAFKRFVRLYPPLWIVLILLLPILHFGLFIQNFTAYQLLSSFLILPIDPSTGEKILAVEWTLRHEVLFYVFFIAVIWNRVAGIVLISIWAVIGSIIGLTVKLSWPISFLFNINHMLFMFGILVALVRERGNQQLGKTAIIIGVTVYLFGWTGYLSGFVIQDAAIILYGIGASSIIYGLVSVNSLNKSIKIIDTMGAASYSLYLIHYPMLAVLTKMAFYVNKHIHLPLTLYFFGMAMTCQIAAICFHLWIERPVVRWCRGGGWLAERRLEGKEVAKRAID